MSDALVEEVEDFLGKGEFSRKKIVKALQRCDNDVDEAVALILDEADDDESSSDDDKAMDNTETQKTSPSLADPSVDASSVAKLRLDSRTSASFSIVASILSNQDPGSSDSSTFQTQLAKTTFSLTELWKKQNDVEPFNFETPSPDDIAKSRLQSASFGRINNNVKQNSTIKHRSDNRRRSGKPVQEQDSAFSALDWRSWAGFPDKSTTATSDDDDFDVEFLASSKKQPEGLVAVHAANKSTQNRKIDLLRANRTKETLKAVVIGAPTVGKTQLIGHCLHLGGAPLQLSEIHTKRLSLLSFESLSKKVCLHELTNSGSDFDNIQTISSCDFVLLVVDGSSKARGKPSSSRIVKLLCHAKNFGIQTVLLCVTKMEIPHLSRWSQQRFSTAVARETSGCLKQAGFSSADIIALPLSGALGENIAERTSDKLDWYTGKTLLQALEDIVLPSDIKTSVARVLVSKVTRTRTQHLQLVEGFVASGAVVLEERLYAFRGLRESAVAAAPVAFVRVASIRKFPSEAKDEEKEGGVLSDDFQAFPNVSVCVAGSRILLEVSSKTDKIFSSLPNSQQLHQAEVQPGDVLSECCLPLPTPVSRGNKTMDLKAPRHIRLRVIGTMDASTMIRKEDTLFLRTACRASSGSARDALQVSVKSVVQHVNTTSWTPVLRDKQQPMRLSRQNLCSLLDCEVLPAVSHAPQATVAPVAWVTDQWEDGKVSGSGVDKKLFGGAVGKAVTHLQASPLTCRAGALARVFLFRRFLVDGTEGSSSGDASGAPEEMVAAGVIVGFGDPSKVAQCAGRGNRTQVAVQPTESQVAAWAVSADPEDEVDQAQTSLKSQTSKTLERQRRLKEKNKAKRSNHNRKANASRKNRF